MSARSEPRTDPPLKLIERFKLRAIAIEILDAAWALLKSKSVAPCAALGSIRLSAQ
jgi:hypothetical protein